jgi:hypothetical protein
MTYDQLIDLERAAVADIYSTPRLQRWRKGKRLRALRERIEGQGWQCAALLTQVLILDL